MDFWAAWTFAISIGLHASFVVPITALEVSDGFAARQTIAPTSVDVWASAIEGTPTAATIAAVRMSRFIECSLAFDV
jgi:hypothetical protein